MSTADNVVVHFSNAAGDHDDVEVQFPIYCQNGHAYYKIMSRNEAYQVELFDSMKGLRKHTWRAPSLISEFQAGAMDRITPAEYQAAFDKAISIFK